MAEQLKIPPALYDFTLFHECAISDYKNSSDRKKIKGDGSLIKCMKWDAKGIVSKTYDAGGKTKFGVTENPAWTEFIDNMKKKYSKNVDTMGEKEWLEVVDWFWNGKGKGSGACGYCANYACAFLLFNAIWLGFTGCNSLLNTLKKNADKKDYKYISSGTIYKKIADSTNAYTDSMVAYSYMKKAYESYLYNSSAPGKNNHVNRMGWLKRVAFEYTPYGLYVQPVIDLYKNMGLTKSSTLEQWSAASIKAAQSNNKYFVKIFDWGVTPEQVANMASVPYEPSSFDGSGSSSGFSSGSYGGCGGVYQLGNYSNAPDAQIIPQQTQNRDEVLQTLINGSYTPDAVKKCEELITVEKKKNVKTKSET